MEFGSFSRSLCLESLPSRFSLVRLFNLDQRARNPTNQSERQLILDGQSSLAALSANRWLLQQAS